MTDTDIFTDLTGFNAPRFFFRIIVGGIKALKC